jgi:hypothetical protein
LAWLSGRPLFYAVGAKLPTSRRHIVDAVKKLQAETAAELDALLPSILDRAFKGEL